jgi:dienelactone hydrolase
MSNESRSDYPLPELHDYFPGRMWEKGLFLIRVFTLLAWLGLWIRILVANSLSLGMKIDISTLLFVVLIGGIILNLYLDMGKVTTNWDDMDYSGLLKRDFEFIPADGHKVFAYIYFPESLDLKTTTQKFPAIIGVHGLNSHHREMDRYCLPSARHLGALYFSYDAYGHGQTPGQKGDLRQMTELREFIDRVKGLPYIDKKRIAVVGMSLGAAKTMAVAYPHPDVKTVVALSGPYDLPHTKRQLSFFNQLLYRLAKVNLNQTEEEMRQVNPIEFMRPEGITLTGANTPTPNQDRVYLTANAGDPLVPVSNTWRAIEKLQLPPTNYRVFAKSDHNFTHNEYYLSVDIYEFLRTHL